MSYTIFGLETVELFSLNYNLLLTLVAVLFIKLCYRFFMGEEALVNVDFLLLLSSIFICKRLPEFINEYLYSYNGIFGNPLHSWLALITLVSFFILFICEIVIMFNGIRDNCY